MSALLALRALTPGDALHRPGSDVGVFAASITQGRHVYKQLRAMAGDDAGFRYIDSASRIAVTHVESGCRLNVWGSSGRTAMGLVNTSLAIADEPSAWEARPGRLLYDALVTAAAKPDSDMKLVIIGTKAPDGIREGHFFYDLVKAGSGPGRHVTSIQGREDKWDTVAELKRCNPLIRCYPESLAALKQELDQARRDPVAAARYRAYRLNMDESGSVDTPLIDASDWAKVLARPVAARQGRPVIAVDMGGNRSWSGICAVYPNGRIEAGAVCGGIPDLAERERADGVAAGTYEKLRQAGSLQVVNGKRIPPTAEILEIVRRRWGTPSGIVCDSFRLNELRDSNPPCDIEPRRAMWSMQTEDVAACRQVLLDGEACVSDCSRDLLAESLAHSIIERDTSGNERLAKKISRSGSRDDVAMAMVMACARHQRDRRTPRGPVVRHMLLERVA